MPVVGTDRGAPERRLRAAEAKLHRARAMAAAAYARLAEVVARHRGHDVPRSELLDAARAYVALRRVLEQHREHVATVRERLDARERHVLRTDPGQDSAAG